MPDKPAAFLTFNLVIAYSSSAIVGGSSRCNNSGKVGKASNTLSLYMLIVPVPKKGDLQFSNNWLGISLLDVVDKPFARIVCK